MEFDVGPSQAPGVKESRVAVIAAESLGTQLVDLIFYTRSKEWLDVVLLIVISLRSCQIHCAASKGSLSASAASENFFKVLAVATDLVQWYTTIPSTNERSDSVMVPAEIVPVILIPKR